jgi:hypothetical protein
MHLTVEQHKAQALAKVRALVDEIDRNLKTAPEKVQKKGASGPALPMFA